MSKLLMCSPDYFNVAYSINPYMDTTNQVDSVKVKQQWLRLKETYLKLGHQVELIDPQSGWPDLVFTANGGLMLPNRQVIVAKFRYPERQGETAFFKKWFVDHNYQLIETNNPFEGQGEAFVWQNKLLAGFGFRSGAKTIEELKTLVGLDVVPLQLVNPKHYHLDMALAPINDELIAYYPAAFDEASRQRIKNLGVKLIEIDDDDAAAFGANLVPLEKTIVMAKGSIKLPKQLRVEGFKVIELDMSEFRKSGGGVRCLTLSL